jgi:hypothetical protein
VGVQDVHALLAQLAEQAPPRPQVEAGAAGHPDEPRPGLLQLGQHGLGPRIGRPPRRHEGRLEAVAVDALGDLTRQVLGAAEDRVGQRHHAQLRFGRLGRH